MVRPGVVLLLFLVLVWHASSYLPFVSDDAFISLRYAQRLLGGDGLTWNDGEWVEGYSNLLWVLVLALYGRLGGDLVEGLRVLGMLSMAVAMAMVLLPRRSTMDGVVPALFFALSAPVAVWAIGGLEQGLAAVLLAASLALLLPLMDERAVSGTRWFAVSVPLALLCTTRPDAPLFVGGIVIAMLWTGRATTSLTLRRVLQLSALPALLVIGQLGFRLLYYGEWVPNTAYAKWSPSRVHAFGGLIYLATGLLTLAPLVLAAAFSAAVCWKRDHRRHAITALCVPILLWCSYIVLIGGDIFPAWRHLVPLIVLLVFLLRIGWEWFGRSTNRSQYLAWMLANIALLGIFFPLQRFDDENLRARSELWEWDGEAIGRALKRAFGTRRPLLAIDAAGSLPFYSELPSLDMLGLTDAHLSHQRDASYGSGVIGHELGDGHYVLDRRPDLVLFGPPPGQANALFRSGLEMQALPGFEEQYLLQRIQVRSEPPLIASLWIRWASRQIGFSCAAIRCEVPGYVFAAPPGATPLIVIPDQRGRWLLELPPGAAIGYRDGLHVPPGVWDVEVEARGSPVNVSVSTRSNDIVTALPVPFEGSDSHSITLTISSEGPHASWVERLTLTRLARPASQ